jgi:hypothetical protein
MQTNRGGRTGLQDLSDQPLAGGRTLKVVASPEVGCDSFKQKQVTVRSAGEHPLLRELRRHWGSYNLYGWEERGNKWRGCVYLRRPVRIYWTRQLLVMEAFLAAASAASWVAWAASSYACRRSCLGITGGSDIAIPGLSILEKPR